MRTRIWLAGLLLVGMFATLEPAPAQAAIWPFSLFAKKTPPKKVKGQRGKPGKPKYNTRTKAIKPTY